MHACGKNHPEDGRVASEVGLHEVVLVELVEDGDGFVCEVDCDDGDPSVYPGASDGCNGVDSDCDGEVDEDFIPQPTSCGVGACSASGVLECVAGVAVDSCQPGPAAPNDAVCNGLDDDCDGLTDEEYASQATSCGLGVCEATGSTSCV